MGRTTIEVDMETRTRLRVWKAERDMTYDEAIDTLLRVANGAERPPPIASGVEYMIDENNPMGDE